jgi:uncharacterized protein YdaU (DUF1376 family)
MHYLPFYTGDYLRHTRHLSIAEHGAYFLLITYCWDMEGPAPLDERKLFGICNARSSDEMEAVRRVLKEFFIKMEDGWYNKRVMEELEKLKAKYQQAVEAGKASARKRNTKKCGLAGNGRSTVVQRTFNESVVVPVSVTDIKESSSSELDQRENQLPTTTTFENIKAKNKKITVTHDWAITEEWITSASSWRPDLIRKQILFSAKRFKIHHLGIQVSLADWLGWIEIEDVSKQPVIKANGKEQHGPPRPPYFHNGEFEKPVDQRA